MPKPEDLVPFAEKMTAWRRDLHRHPELGFKERRTAAKVAALLHGWGIDVTEGLARTPGAYAWLGTGDPSHPEGWHHNPHFDFNDAALVHGAAFWCSLVETELA